MHTKELQKLKTRATKVNTGAPRKYEVKSDSEKFSIDAINSFVASI